LTDDEDFTLDDEEAGSPPDDLAEDTAEVICPYCGELVEVALDAGGGARQEYVEDCQVCCRPWKVKVTWGRDGVPTVTVDADDEEDLGDDG